MIYVTHNDQKIIIKSSASIGNLHANYEQLTKHFGKPRETHGEKDDVEWLIKFSNGTIFAIHNWKDGKNYLGDEGLTPEEITLWVIARADETMEYFDGIGAIMKILNS